MASVPEPTPPTPKHKMEYLFLVGLFVLWIVLQVWVLPKAGVRT
jgi:hypothetical protein